MDLILLKNKMDKFEYSTFINILKYKLNQLGMKTIFINI